MEFIQAFALGLIQGITEFLPISSTAHLMILPEIFGFPYHGRTMDIFLNIGTLAAVFVFYRHDIWNLIWGLCDFLRAKKSDDREFFLTIFLASAPLIVIFGIIEVVWGFEINSMLILGINLIFFGVLLMITDTAPTKKKIITRRDAIITGLWQMLSLFPGVSRLGICYMMLRQKEYDRQEAFKFSMLLSIPPVAGACVLKMIKVISGDVAIIDLQQILLSALVAFGFGLLSITLVTELLAKHSFIPLMIYRIIFGIYVTLRLFMI